MRKADIDHAWGTLRSAPKGRLIPIELNFISGDLAINASMMAIVGANGSKKTTLLDTIYHFFSKQDLHRRIPSKLLSIKIQYNGKPTVVYSNEISPPGAKLPDAIFIDPSRDVQKLIQYYSAQSNLDELLAQSDPKQISDSEKKIYQFISKRNYDKIEILEIENPENPEDVIPYFSIISNNIEYRTLDMGLGELCIFHLVWAIKRTRKGTVILLDEPDSHLSPASRKNLSDFLAYEAVEREHLILMTSHSTETVNTISNNEIIVMDQSGSHASVSGSSSDAIQLALLELGILQHPRVLIATEDIDSLECIQQILASRLPKYAHTFDPRIVGPGETEIIKFQTLFPQDNRICRLLITLDGDKRGGKYNDKVSFIPGSKDPMYEAIHYLFKDSQHFVISSGINQEVLTRAIKLNEHSNHHDFCSNLAMSLNIPGYRTSRIRELVISNWLRDPKIQLQIQELADFYSNNCHP